MTGDAEPDAVPDQDPTPEAVVEAPPGEVTPARSPRLLLGYCLGAIALVGLSFWLLQVIPQAGDLSFHEVGSRIQFAGTPGRLVGQLPDVELGQAQTAVLFSFVFSLVWGLVGWFLLDVCWSQAWRTGPGRDTSGRLLAWALAGGGLAAATVEKLLTLVSLTGSTGMVTHRSWVLSLLVVAFAWIKWLLAGLLICVVFAMTVSVATRASRQLLPDPDPAPLAPDLPDPSDPDNPPPPSGIGICCSGGGIRAAAFALGGLARLERPIDRTNPTNVLARASYLASVSGGGYAATAWRIAAGTGPNLPAEPIIGNPLDPDRVGTVETYRRDHPDTAMDLLDHIQQRRHYLSNGPGGVLRSLLRAVRNTSFHFFLVLTTVLVLAWPLGRIIVGYAVTGVGVNRSMMTAGIGDVDFGPHRWFPPLFLFLVAMIVLAVLLRQEQPRVQRLLDLALKVSLGMAITVAVITIGLPWAVNRFILLLPNAGADQVAASGIYGMIVTAVWHTTKNKLRPMTRYLGGLFLAIGVAAFALFVMGNAADTDAPFSSPWIWLAALVFTVVAFVFFNPDRWSLHPIYREGLAGTFAAVRDEAGGIRPLPPGAEPALADYRSAAGPQPIICCAAARRDRSQTGLKVLSMTFDPWAVTVHGWKGRGQAAGHDPLQISHADFQRRLPRTLGGNGLRTLIGAAAISGAAVAPSLGRLDMKSTNALLAAFNARLGVWVPNPTQSYARSTTPRVVNMFKEILGMYNSDDPNVYATDGGHWENLGLVELIRRRCAVIFCIDASGDPPGSYQAVRNAVDLASLECKATITLTDALEGDLKAVDGARPAKNFAVGHIRYDNTADDDEPATLIYVKAAVSDNSPIHIQRYAAGDPRFPNYSTGDQFLAQDEFVYLVQLGYNAMDQALQEHRATVDTVLENLA